MLTQLDYTQVWNGLCHAGYWSIAVVALWSFLYIFNTASWYIIINSGGKTPVRFWWLYKITVSGFALNYATPGGLMGGEPYRIMSLSPIVLVAVTASPGHLPFVVKLVPDWLSHAQ